MPGFLAFGQLLFGYWSFILKRGRL